MPPPKAMGAPRGGAPRTGAPRTGAPRGGVPDVSPALRFAVNAIRQRRSNNGRPLDSKAVKAFFLDIVKDKIISTGSARITASVLKSNAVLSSLGSSSVQSLLRKLYRTEFGRHVIHRFAGHAPARAGAAVTSAAAVNAAYTRIGTTVIASVLSLLLRCGWDFMEALMGAKPWSRFFRGFIVAVGATAGGIAGWVGGAAAGASIASLVPGLGMLVGGGIGAVCAFAGAGFGDYAAAKLTTDFVSWFLGEENEEGPRGRGGTGKDGRKRERSGDGRSSRVDGRRRPKSLDSRGRRRPHLREKGEESSESESESDEEKTVGKRRRRQTKRSPSLKRHHPVDETHDSDGFDSEPVDEKIPRVCEFSGKEKLLLKQYGSPRPDVAMPFRPRQQNAEHNKKHRWRRHHGDLDNRDDDHGSSDDSDDNARYDRRRAHKRRNTVKQFFIPTQ